MKITLEFGASYLGTFLGAILVQVLTFMFRKWPRRNGRSGRGSARRSGR